MTGRHTTAILTLLTLAACTNAPPPPALAAPRPDAAPTPAAADPEARFGRALLASVQDYPAWGRVDDEVRWAPWLCRQPLPPQARLSSATGAGGHARKLYSLLAKDREAYVRATEPAPVGQVIVKETWVPEPCAADDEAADEPTAARLPRLLTRAVDGLDRTTVDDHGRRVRTGARGPLFVMAKVAAPGTDGTDRGWIYATLSPDGDRVTAIGRLASCMRCHREAAHDRQFGLPDRDD